MVIREDELIFGRKIIVSGPSRGSALTWHRRMKIALDTAR